ncbi:MAG: hormogonium polysaccharide biosynthesis protein HpsA [Halothece sp. Uz-M2-17]|nr:hormogonium polysaccharide biosynthesis protein HpsA [Halothece sp. Uz-M2-17]
MNQEKKQKHSKRGNQDYREILRQYGIVTQRQLNWLLRAYILNTPAKTQAGFLLPTITMSLLVLSLVVGSILIRTTNRSIQVIRDRENTIIYNYATPAIDRAKAKLEYLFQSDSRFPTSIPGEDYLDAMMRNNPNFDDDGDGTNESIDYDGDGVADISVLSPDLYTLPDEQRVDINNDGTLDNAWSYTTDLDGDGTSETVTYSVLMDSEVDTDNDGTADVSLQSGDAMKASNLITRSGPLSINNQVTSSASCTLNIGDATQGWFPINSATVRKNFQINAVVVNENDAARSVSALEFQQDRQLDKGNKFGAWFRYDLVIHAGPDFNWNGAMHTDGNLILFNDDHRFYLASAPDSCIDPDNASDITLNQVVDENNNILFQGQLIIDDGGGTNDNSVDIDASTNVDLTNSSDSRKGSSPNYKNDNISRFSVDPLLLYTEDITRSRFGSDDTNKSVRDPDWKDTDVAKRIFNERQDKPYVDDTYRADDRWGPRPNYGREASDQVTISNIGTQIPSSRPDLLELNPPSEALDQVGLDGYWERRAYVEGLRVITGQRLELGNAFGWQGNDDPLYPAENSFSGQPISDRDNEYRQQRTWRDNLAAVQATTVYHHADNKDFPVACLATTAHPGTAETITNSTTFDTDSLDLNGDGTQTTTILTNFFEGTGTNGWEFNPPAASASDFATAIDNETGALHLALTNLGNFAGDPDGAFPPTQETSSTETHPYPHLTMWGNFSNLRRVMDRLDDSGVNYADLSLADKTTLHTAACTLGMLGHNINLENALTEEEQATAETNANAITPSPVAIGQHLISLISQPTGSSQRVYNYIENNDVLNDDFPGNDGLASSGNGSDPIKDPVAYFGVASESDLTQEQLEEYFDLFTSEQYLEALEEDPGLSSFDQSDIDAMVAFVENQTTGGYSQIRRDRIMGFQPGLPPAEGSTSNWDPTTGQSDYETDYKPSGGGGKIDINPKTGCDPDIFEPLVGSGGGQEEKKLGLAITFCGGHSAANFEPKYPSLYYLFPTDSHDHDGTGAVVQPSGEEYIADSYISSTANPSTAGNNLYRAVDPSAIALQPKALGSLSLPMTTTAQSGVDEVSLNEITYDGTTYYTSMLDRVIQNGRQLMAARTLTMDLSLLTGNQSGSVDAGSSTIGGESWIPNSGVIYAFREDAVREDAIARPAGDTWANCDTESELIDFKNDNTCHMDISDNNDPPVNATTGISPKPVDAFPDPDRRPHGFRLINGIRLDRSGTDRGMSLISDQPIYIQGDFNLHQDSNGNDLEEFKESLKNNWNNFYDRDTLEPKFAKPGSDLWRPTEILSDAITVLSTNFCDGNIESGITREDASECDASNQRSSFLNSLLKDEDSIDSYWRRENPDDTNSPIRVSRNGEFEHGTSSDPTAWETFDEYESPGANRDLSDSKEDVTVNTVFVSAIVPTTPADNSYGGLHNYPRFNEDWNHDLFIAGSFIQLNFSTYDTATYRNSNWEPGIDTGGNIRYYRPPGRRWGYDVGLLYNPPGPVADRLFSTSARRSEFYKELPADDPYSQGLLCAQDSNGNQIYADESCP